MITLICGDSATAITDLASRLLCKAIDVAGKPRKKGGGDDEEDGEGGDGGGGSGGAGARPVGGLRLSCERRPDGRRSRQRFRSVQANSQRADRGLGPQLLAP